jgi:hypothetical protein
LRVGTVRRYADASDALFFVWRPARWANWMFEARHRPGTDPALARDWPGTGTGPAQARHWLSTGPALALARHLARHWPGPAPQRPFHQRN